MFEELTSAAVLLVPKYKWRCVACLEYLEDTVGHSHEDSKGMKRSRFIYLKTPASELDAYGTEIYAELLRRSIQQLPPPTGFKMCGKPPWVEDPEGTILAWYTDAEQLIALGVPGDEVHDCDIAGCGQLHVLYRELLIAPEVEANEQT